MASILETKCLWCKDKDTHVVFIIKDKYVQYRVGSKDVSCNHVGSEPTVYYDKTAEQVIESLKQRITAIWGEHVTYEVIQ